MKRAAIFVALLAGSSAQAQTYLCEDCRDILSYPIDAAAFAMNAVYGPEQFIPFQGADSFYVMDYAGNRVLTDVNASMNPIWILTMNLRRIGILVPLIPEPKMDIQVIVQDAQSRVLEQIRISMPRDEDLLPLPVGSDDDTLDSIADASPTSSPISGSTDSGGGSSGSGGGGGYVFEPDDFLTQDFLWFFQSLTSSGSTCTWYATIDASGDEEVRLVCNY